MIVGIDRVGDSKTELPSDAGEKGNLNGNAFYLSR